MKNEEVKEKKTQGKKNTSKNTTTKKKETKGTTKKSETKKTQPKKEIVVKEEVEKEKVVIKEVKNDNNKEEQSVKSKKKNRNSDFILIIGLVIVIILGAFILTGESEEITYELPLTLTGEVGLHQLTYDEYREKVDNKEAFVLIIERATCSHCVSYMPVAEDFALDNGVPMYYVDTDTFSSEDWDGFEKSNTFLRKNYNSWGTPTTVVLVGSKALDYIEGETTAENLKELYNEYFEITQE